MVPRQTAIAFCLASHSMSILVFQHESNEPAAILGDVLQRQGHRLRTVKLFAGESIPTDLDDVDGIVTMGGSANVDEVAKHSWMQPEMDLIKTAREAGLPVVGICLGAQLIAAAMGGKVEKMETPEVGWETLNVAFPGTTDPVFSGITWKAPQFHLHGQQITELPPGATPLAGSAACRTQAFKMGFNTYAFQFHFEWSQQAIAEMSRNELFASAGVTSESVLAGTKQHFSTYRRLGDRLCENIATFLFPIDKRAGR